MASAGFFCTIALLNKFPILIRATTDDYEPIPGFSYGEINKISYETEDICQQLHAYFEDRLENDSCFVKLKVLKLIRHLILNGSSLYRNILRKQHKQIKTCTNFSGPPDSRYGLTVYQAVRNEAKEVLQLLFDSQAIEGDQVAEGHARSPGKFMAGMGPSRQSGKYDGFGFSSPLPEKTVTEKMVNSISELMGKLVNRADGDAESCRRFLQVERGPYHAVNFTINPGMFSTKTDSIICMERMNANDDNTSTISLDSLENSESRVNDVPERQFVEDVSRLSCGADGLLARNQLAAMRHRYGLLRGSVVLLILKEKCSTENAMEIRLKTVQILEDFLHHGAIGAEDVRQLLFETFTNLPETDSPIVCMKTKKLLHITDWKLLHAINRR